MTCKRCDGTRFVFTTVKTDLYDCGFEIAVAPCPKCRPEAYRHIPPPIRDGKMLAAGDQ